MSAPRTAFVICTHDNRGIIDACLTSVKAQTAGDWECVVVDDASADGTPEWIEARHPWVRVVRSARNVGPALCRNLGFEETRADLIAFLDSDVELDPGWLEATRSALLSDPSLGIVGGKLLLAARRELLHSFGGTLGRLGIGWHHHEAEEGAKVADRQESLWVCSAAMLTRRALLDRVGGFDETFFYGYEDSDLGWRARLAGFSVVSIPEALAYHRVSDTIGKMGDRIVFHACKNRLRSLLKNYAASNLTRWLPPYLGYALLDVVLRKPRAARLRALGWNLRRLGDTLARRRAVQATRVRTDAELAPLFSSSLVTPAGLRRRRQAVARAVGP
jgi:GT2 family glycosyltransferase